jgi:Invasin, domain 3/von Willebrand factor type A domain
MRWRYILVFLLLCAAPALAAAAPPDPVNLQFSSNKEWVIADGSAITSVFTVLVTDKNGDPIEGAGLVFTIDSPWSLVLASTATRADGTGYAQLSPTTKSGSPKVTVTVTVPGVPDPRTATLAQDIDATTPYVARYAYPSAATVASKQNITVSVADKYGNPVTSRRLPNAVDYATTDFGSGGFPDSDGNLVKTGSALLNDTGYATIPYSLNTVPGNNYVTLAPPAPIGMSLICITGVGNSQPFSIVQSVSPPGNPPFVMTGDKEVAMIDYYLYDQWGNPSTGQDILITTSAGESRTFITNMDGRATVIYGPKTTAGNYYITATAVQNKSVKITQTIQFASGDPKDMLLTASPQTMASREVNENMVASVIAKVIDVKGNPVRGQTVTFRIKSVDWGSFTNAGNPEIESNGVRTTVPGAPIPVMTNEDGQAILYFYPGSFPKYGVYGFNENSQAAAIINATWEGPNGEVIRDISLSYKNYPFLSVYTDVIPKTVQLGGAVDVSVRLVGDGWALQPKPIDVVLVTDRSATMLNNESVSPSGTLVEESPNDRMVDAMNAAVAFVGKTSGQDRIGLVSFGDPLYGYAVLFPTGDVTRDLSLSKDAWRAGRDYNDKCVVGGPCKDNVGYRDGTDDKIYVNAHYPGHGAIGKNYNGGPLTGVFIESPLTYDKTQIANAIEAVVPAGGTPMRPALYTAVKQIINDPEVVAGKRNEAVRAIVLLTDGRYNTGGDPRGISTAIPLAAYPELGTMGTGSVITWAAQNHIKIFTIALVGSDPSDQPNVAELKAYADETLGKAYVANSGLDLKQIYIDIAGALQEEASINTQVALDFNTIQVNDEPGIPGNTVFDYMFIPGLSTQEIRPVGEKPPTRDDTNNWTTNQLTFSPGTIKINEVWRVNFTLIPKKEGNIRVFSSKSSKVTFLGTEGGVTIPDTFITAIPPGTEKGPEGINFKIQFADPARTNPDSDKNVAMLRWHVEYDAKGRDNEIEQRISVSPICCDAYGDRETFSTLKGVDTVDYNLVISNLQPGRYKVKVLGHVSDADDSWDVTTINIPEDPKNPQIKIQ